MPNVEARSNIEDYFIIFTYFGFQDVRFYVCCFFYTKLLIQLQLCGGLDKGKSPEPIPTVTLPPERAASPDASQAYCCQFNIFS
ncbi:14200_t:CDS:2 [Rhizophagus irregularis]|uniref:Uncharacterized protein n=1 Tax=Rhizophagus irregularis (strain DAOM 181602 / DAOM 197198 / MUCL 43194) TaxID=747089 RepID=U9U5D1_RHIID|nr:14200_t:CDS:2 [Rhizophagus irregularis]